MYLSLVVTCAQVQALFSFELEDALHILHLLTMQYLYLCISYISQQYLENIREQ